MVRGEGVKFSVLGLSEVVAVVQVVPLAVVVQDAEVMDRVLFVTVRLTGAVLMRVVSLIGLLEWRREANAEAMVTEAIARL